MKPRILMNKLEWYSSHCCFCGTLIFNLKTGFKEGTYQCQVLTNDGRNRQLIVCSDCLEEYKEIVDISA